MTYVIGVIVCLLTLPIFDIQQDGPLQIDDLRWILPTTFLICAIGLIRLYFMEHK